jgi:hypothetical protein
MKRLVPLLVLLLAVTATAEAQELAGTFDQLRVLVKPGDTLTLTDAAGQRVQGKLADLSASALELDISGTRRRFQSGDVDVVEKRGADSLKNGALIGLSIGAGFAGTALGLITQEWAYTAVGALIYGGIGAGIGAGVDALIEGRRVIYARSGSAQTSVHIAPILSRSRKGVLLSLNFGTR